MIRVDDTWSHGRALVATVFIKRRAMGMASPRKSLRVGPRVWSDRSGTFRVEADLKDVNDGKVHLLKLNGVRVAVPLEKLCKADLLHLNMVRPFTAFQADGTPALPRVALTTAQC